MPTLSIIIPVYNEHLTLDKVLRGVMATLPDLHELIVVDDGSSDGTSGVLCEWAAHPVVKVVIHEANRGKGAAIRSGLAAATGELIAIQDADLEYDPADLPRLVQPLLDDEADVVYGSRFAGNGKPPPGYWVSRMANRVLTRLSNLLTGLQVTDMECGYKVFRSRLLDDVELVENRFGFEPEITAKLARQKPRVVEVPIRYRGRTYRQGKKIRAGDAVRAVYAIVKYRVKK